MNLFIYDNNQQTGPFPPESVLEMVRVGSVSPQAMVWHEGAPDWVPLATFLAPPGNPVVPTPPPLAPLHPAAAAVARAAASTSRRQEDPPGLGALFVRALGAGFAAAVVLGAAWAALQVVTEMRLQLPLILGCGIAYACAWTVGKVSREMAGWPWISLAIGAAGLAWIIGIFGVALVGEAPRIGVWTVASFVLAMGTAWRVATE